MKIQILATIFTFCFVSSAFAQTTQIDIIPRPREVGTSSGSFIFSRKTKIVAHDEAGRNLAQNFNDLLLKNYGFKLAIVGKNQKNSIQFVTEGLPVSMDLNPDQYHLTIDSNVIEIAGGARGMFYGLQSLIQLLPENISK